MLAYTCLVLLSHLDLSSEHGYLGLVVCGLLGQNGHFLGHGLLRVAEHSKLFGGFLAELGELRHSFLLNCVLCLRLKFFVELHKPDHFGFVGIFVAIGPLKHLLILLQQLFALILELDQLIYAIIEIFGFHFFGIEELFVACMAFSKRHLKLALLSGQVMDQL